MNRVMLVSLVAVAAVAYLEAEQAPAPSFVFRDVGDEAGIFPHLTGIHGHAAGWGDVDGDGWIDLYVGSFFQQDGKPNLLLRNQRGKFQLDEQPGLRVAGRPTGVVFADLDNDGDLDLYVGSMPQAKQGLAGCALFRNDGGGKFADISKDHGACPVAFGGRSVAVLDHDGDGLLDLLVGEDPIPGYNGSKTKSSRLFRNKGNLQFEDVTQAVGIPPDIPGLGVAAADVNGDGWPDIFVAARSGGNRLFLNDGKGKFSEAPGTRQVFDWSVTSPRPRGDDTPCGVCFGDVNRDGLLDIVIGHHYQRPWLEPVFNRLYLNRGLRDGQWAFEDVSAAAGLKALPMKAPHVEIQDFDNDGWPDIYGSMVKFAANKPCPLICKNLGVRDGLPRFREDCLAINDFPTPEDRAIQRSGPFFDKVIKDKKVIYMAPGPAGDYDNDGRLDLFLPNWWVESRSLLLHNETPGGHWLQVQVQWAKGGNRMGIGARINLYPAGKLGQVAALLGCREISTGYGYASGQPAIAHFGLGKETRVDVEVILPHAKGKLSQKDVPADQRITIKP